MEGNAPAPRIYKTTSMGVYWDTTSTNLNPNIPIVDLIVHPTNNNILYLCTVGYGFLKSTDGGISWTHWNNGLPSATICSEMNLIDSSSIGKYYILAATDGRGMYIRDISGDDPIGIKHNNNSVPGRFELSQNYPNPFNPTTEIKFGIPKTGLVKLVVYNILGQEVATLVNEVKEAGSYNVSFNASELPSGVYFYKLTSANFSDTKKMLLVK
jgi:hypothetical protein